MQPGSLPTASVVPPRRLSVKEQALWMLQRLVPGTAVSNEALVLRVGGRLDLPVLTAAINHLTRRHPTLRTVFPELRGEPAALVLPAERAEVRVSVLDATDVPADRVLREVNDRPFDLSREVPLRVTVVREPDGDTCLLTMHHLAFDAKTAAELCRELVVCYDALAAGGAIPPSVAGPVEPYVEPPARPASLAYWQDHIAAFDPADTALAVGGTDPVTPTFAGDVQNRPLAAATGTAVRDLGSRLRVTENIVLLAAYYALLTYHGGGPDLVVGVSVDTRERPDRVDFGYLVNTLPVRSRVDLTAGFADLVKQVRDGLLAAVAHRDVPYEAVLPDLQAAGTHWRTPLFRHMFNYRPMSVALELTMGGLRLTVAQLETGHSRQDLEFVVVSGQDGVIDLRAEFSTEIFRADEVADLLDRYEALLVAAAAEPGRPLVGLEWWTDRDRAAVAGPPDDNAPRAATLVPAAVAGLPPDAVAMHDGERSYRHRQLLAAAARTADRLREAGVGPGAVVAVDGPYGARAVAALLGVWLADAVYLPIDPSQPDEAAAADIRGAGTAAVLTSGPAPEARWAGRPVVAAAEPAEDVTDRPRAEHLPAAGPGDRAYLLVSTDPSGRRRTIELTHADLATVVDDLDRRLGVGVGTCVRWMTDPALWSAVAGRPVDRTTAFVAGPDGLRLPPGVAGELCLTGANGHHRTGDRARRRRDGTLELLGPAGRPRRRVAVEPAAVGATAGLVDLLVDMWRETLQDPGLGPDDNFFLSGGHSLVAVQLLRRLGDRLGTEVPLVSLLDAPTPAGLAAALAAPATAGPR